MAVATQRIFGPLEASGSRRLLAAPGDTVPAGVEMYDADGEPLDPRAAVLRSGTLISEPDPVTTALVPFDGYDVLSEAEVLARLPTLDAATLVAVQDYERAHLARGAITRYGKRSKVVGTRPDEPPLDVPSRSLSEGWAGRPTAELDAEIARRGLKVRGTSDDAKARALEADDAKRAAAQ